MKSFVVGLTMGAWAAAVCAAEVSLVETRGDVNAAVGRVAASGGGRVFVPAGDWETPGLVLKSNVELHLEKGARILFATNLSGFVRLDVPRCEGCTHALVSAIGATNVAITGEGELVGRGGSWPQPGPHQPHLIRPKGVVFANCRDIRLSDFLLRDSPSWGIVFKCCDGVVARRVRVDSHANANNDGFDIEARNVLLEYCDVDSGDDAYCLKSNDPDFVMENVTVRGCIGRSNCNGFKIGTASHGTVRRVRFENCLTEAPRRSFVSRVDAPSAPKAGEEWFRFNRTREWPGGPEHLAGMAALAVECVDGGEVSDVVCSGLLVYGMMTPIFIRGGERTGRETPAGTKYVLKDVRVEGCVAVAESFVPSSVTGAGRCRPENVLLKNVRIRVKPHRAPCPDAEIPELPGKYPEANMFGLLPAHGLYVRHVTGLKLDDVVFEAAGDTRPRVRTEDVTDFAERPHPPGKRATDPDLAWRWLGDAKRDARIRAKRVEQLANAGRDYDAVWLGDSITHRWESEAGQPEFERSFGRYRILNMGFGGDKTQNVLWNILYGKVLDGYRTRIVSLLIGTNNIWQRTPEEIAAGVKLCLEAIRAKQPEAKVLLYAVLPREVAHQRGTRNFRRKNRPNVDEVAPKIRRVNELIRPFADGKDVLFVDLTARFTDAEGLPDIGLLGDGTHPNAAGYRIWADEVLPVYRTILPEGGGR